MIASSPDARDALVPRARDETALTAAGKRVSTSIFRQDFSAQDETAERI